MTNLTDFIEGKMEEFEDSLEMMGLWTGHAIGKVGSEIIKKRYREFLRTFSRELIQKVGEEIKEWAEKNTVDIKGGNQTAGGTPEKWTYYIKLQDVRSHLKPLL